MNAKTKKLAIDALERQYKSLAVQANLFERYGMPTGERAYQQRREIAKAIADLKGPQQTELFQKG